MVERDVRIAVPAWAERSAQFHLLIHPPDSLGVVAEPPAFYHVAKRGLDILGGAALLLLASPLLLLVALLIRLTSPGPVIYRQQRVGKGGHIFTMFKFRSMRQGADHDLHRQAYARFMRGHAGSGKVDAVTLAELVPAAERHRDVSRAARRNLPARVRAWLTPEDPRVTWIGHLIRRASIDELPQLLNVLRGEMSLVGPRPPIPYEVRLYSPRHLRRLEVTPGVTGMWQVCGRGVVPFDQMVDMDIIYIAYRSFWLDLRLLARTLPAVLRSRGAK
jgi:lipopolysaccharide/colanic/teichoic acid biosynthesis glycosyltransferase